MFKELATSIVKFFPGEDESVYYVPSVTLGKVTEGSELKKTAEKRKSNVVQTSTVEKVTEGSELTKTAEKRKSNVIQASGRLFYAYINTKKRSPVFGKGNCKKICEADPAPEAVNVDVRDSQVVEGRYIYLYITYPKIIDLPRYFF